MKMCKTAALADRALIRVGGEDAQAFLQGLVTCDVSTMDAGEAAHGALLSPQGKILFDFFVIGSLDAFILDVAAKLAPDLARRLQFYKLRAKVEIAPFDERTSVHACWDGDVPQVDGIAVVDPRLATMGTRLYCRRPPEGCEAGDYHAHRIGVGMPEGGLDFSFGDAFPHEALMDQTGGVDFRKGCYVGQEVVSRMQHRGTARRRVVMIEAQQDLPHAGTEILAGSKVAGEMGSNCGRSGLAMLRLDRAADALDAGEQLSAGVLPVTARLQPWVKYGWR
jgi:folate-binding protein YgfZ